jgi:hypothetical protein
MEAACGVTAPKLLFASTFAESRGAHLTVIANQYRFPVDRLLDWRGGVFGKLAPECVSQCAADGE